MLDHVRSIVQHEPADFLVNFSLNRDESSSCARYIGTANLRFPLDGGVSLFFSAEESENSSCFELEGEISCFNFEETVLVLDIKGDISEKFASLRIIPRGYESNTVTANLSYENAFSFLLDTPVGTLTIEADPSFYMPSFAIRASGFGFSLDGKFSRYLFYTPSVHVGLRYPSFPPSSAGMKYDYVTLEPDGTLQVRYGRSLLTSRVVPNTNNNGIRNVTALTFDRDVASTGDTRCGLLTTSIRQILNSIRISQVLEENNETYELWSLEASPSIQPVDAIADAQVLDAQFLRALPDRIIRYFAQESAAAQPDGKESISVQ